MKVIELKDVKKSYGKNEILHGISLDIEEGSIHGLVGRNGCGKTTLIKCLTGIYEQDQGQILVCGEEIFENPKVKAQVGYVADSNQYFEGYHIDEMVEFYKQIYQTFDEKVFRDYNQSIGLDVSKRIKELSKGQAMSLASMLNLSIHPKVMIMDEPMSGLDVIAQKQIKDFIVNEVDRLCTVWMNKKPVLSCSVLAARADGKEIVTLEGVQERAAEFGTYLANQGGEQCGFCNPGFIMNVLAMEDELDDPTEEEIKAYLSGNLCRCSGYESQLRAIKNYLNRNRDIE